LKEELDKGEVSPEEAFKLLFESLKVGGQKKPEEVMPAAGIQNLNATANLRDTIVMLKDKSGMSNGTTAQIVGSNRTQWKLSNGKAIQRDQHMEAWAVLESEEE
jgi:hypothetical protein